MKRWGHNSSVGKWETTKYISMYRWMLHLYWFSILPGSTTYVLTRTEYRHITSPCLRRWVTWTRWMGMHNGVYWIVSSFLSRLCFLPSYLSVQISRSGSLMCAHKHGGISPPFSFPSIPSLCLDSNSTTSLCLCCIYSYAPLNDLLIYLFTLAGRGREPCRRSVFSILAGTAGRRAASPKGDIFLSILPFPSSWCIMISYFQFASMPLQVRL